MTALQNLDNPHVPGASPTFNQFVAGVRLYMRDYPELNRLVAGEESSGRMIAFAVLEALSDFTAHPPNLGVFSFEYFLARGWTHHLRIGTICRLLEMVGILQTRNHLPFSDGGLNVAVSDKTPLLQSWIQLFERRWETWKERTKISENIARCMGTGGEGLASEYFAIHGYFSRAYW